MPYEWTEFLLSLLARQGIEPYEVGQVLASPCRWPRPAMTEQGMALTIWGRTKAGRGLVVLLRPGEGPFNQVIMGARGMTAAESQEFRQWEERRS